MSTIQLGKSCSPSTITTQRSQQLREFLVSYGGGMGGTNVYYYGEELATSPRKGFIAVLGYDGELTEINQSYIVSVKDKQLVTIVSDVTAHRNFNKTVCSKAIETRHFLLPKDADFNISNTIQTDKSQDVNLLSRTLVTT